MFDSSTFPSDILANPTKVVRAVIQAMENAMGGDLTIPDVNNGMVIQLGAATGIFASIAQELDTNYSFYYGKRAQTPAQLYPKLSQFDYVNLTAGPASMPFVFEMQKEYIIANAVSFDDNYNIIEIPVNTSFTVGSITFSTYYPIIIYVNKNTDVITAVYDTSKTNPLYTLESNMLYAPLTEYTQDGINRVRLTFEMFQFTRTSNTTTVTTEEGFNKSFSYNDQFYAVRVYSVDTSGNSTELEISLSSMYYDISTPTAIITIDNVNNEVTVTVPQIYFTSGSVSSQILVEVYSTKGSIDYTIPISDAVNGVTANFAVSSSKYAAGLSQMSIYTLYALNEVLVGGSDAMTFAEMKKAIVNQELYDRIPISLNELDAAGAKLGYKIQRYVDSLTDRIFFASSTLTDSNDNTVPVVTGSILIAGDSLTGDPSTILAQTDGSITILPTTLFTLNSSNNLCVPVKDSAIAALTAMTTTNRIAALNTTQYLRQPFHICLSTDDTSPSARTYNLANPSMTSLVFVRENIHSSPQMSITNVQLQALENGTGGFVMRMAVTMTSNMVSVDPSKIKIVLSTQSKSDSVYTLEATYVSTNDSGMIYDINFGTNYLIDTDDYINVIMTNASGTLSWALLPLNPVFDVRLMVDQSVFPSIAQDTELTSTLNFTATNYLQIARQTLTVSFGTNMSSMIYSAVDTSWGGTSYKTYDTDVYSTVTSNIYQRDSTGKLETRVDSSGNLEPLIILYAIGDRYVSEGVITTTLSSQATAGDLIIHVVSATGVLIGQPVVIPGQTTATYVKSLNGTAITLTAAVDVSSSAGTGVSFTNARVSIRTTVAQSAVGITVPLADTTNIFVGMSIYGYNVPTGATVASVIDNTSITMSLASTTLITAGTLLTFINKTAPGIIQYSAGSVVMDANGNPTVLASAANQYRIPAIMFDGRLYESEDSSDVTLVKNMSSRLASFAEGTTNLKLGLAEQQQVFYRPTRTIGSATFGIGNGKTKYLPLALSFTVILTVPTAVYANSATKSALSDLVISTINTAVKETIISCAGIASAITTALGSSVTGVNVSGINNDSSLVIIALQDTDAVCSVEGILVENTNGTISRNPNITITFVESPDGS